MLLKIILILIQLVCLTIYRGIVKTLSVIGVTLIIPRNITNWEWIKDQNWYSSQNVYRISKEIDFVRYSHYTDFTTLYLFMFDRYLYIYEQTKLRNFL